jgi:hypothetical protein
MLWLPVSKDRFRERLVGLLPEGSEPAVALEVFDPGSGILDAVGVLGAFGALFGRRSRSWYSIAVIGSCVLLISNAGMGQPETVIDEFDLSELEIQDGVGDFEIGVGFHRFRVPGEWVDELWKLKKLGAGTKA